MGCPAARSPAPASHNPASGPAATVGPVPGRTVVVIPCFDEAERLDPERVLALAAHLDVLLVDDGSADSTVTVMRSIARRSNGRVDVLELGSHAGKAEAVRRGLRSAGSGDDVAIVGYCDADFATPPDEVVRLAAALRRRPELTTVIGSRVGLLGHDLERPWYRTIGNRVYSGFASRVLGIRIRDTQCGAKFFRSGTALAVATSEPFADQWGFDAELLGRLLVGRAPADPVRADEIGEVPLERWSHVAGSKLGGWAAVRALAGLTLLPRRLRRWRQRHPVDVSW